MRIFQLLHIFSLDDAIGNYVIELDKIISYLEKRISERTLLSIV
jgi:hypothetical protein